MTNTGEGVKAPTFYDQGRAAWERGEPLSNSPRAADPNAAPEWRRGWFYARAEAGRSAICSTDKGG